jgi:hypothetical protein
MKPPRNDDEAADRAAELEAAFAQDTTELVFSDGKREIRELAPLTITGDAWRETPHGRVLNHEPLLEPGDCTREQMILRGFGLLNEAGDQVAYAPLNDRDRDRPQPALHAAAQHDPFLKTKTDPAGGEFQWPTTFKTLTWSPRIFAGRIASSRSARRSRASIATPSSCAIRWAPAGSPAGRRPAAQLQFRRDRDGRARPFRRGARRGHHAQDRALARAHRLRQGSRAPAQRPALARARDRSGVGLQYAPAANFGVAKSEDRRALGCYGTGACGPTR